jgi:hypothetical protein
LARHKANSFWTFIESLDSFLETQSKDEDRFSFAKQKITSLLDKNEQIILEYALNVRYFSPAVQKYREFWIQHQSNFQDFEIRQTCGANWVLFRNHVYCDPSKLEKALS